MKTLVNYLMVCNLRRSQLGISMKLEESRRNLMFASYGYCLLQNWKKHVKESMLLSVAKFG